MFTGLVEGIGTVAGITSEGDGVRLGIDAPGSLATSEPPSIGDSISINGCCLTVVSTDRARWEFQAGSETLSRTNLGQLSPGDRVNLERSLRADARLGGHFVQGHIDAVGHVERIIREGEWVTMWFTVPAHLTRQMVSKGSIAVDGISLTLVDVTENGFSVALIPHTLKETTLGLRHEGDPVNIETDILGKYCEKLVRTMGQTGDAGADD